MALQLSSFRYFHSHIHSLAKDRKIPSQQTAPAPHIFTQDIPNSPFLSILDVFSLCFGVLQAVFPACRGRGTAEDLGLKRQ